MNKVDRAPFEEQANQLIDSLVALNRFEKAQKTAEMFGLDRKL